MAWTGPEHVEERWVGDELPADTVVILRLIGDAEELIRYEYPNIPSRIEDTDTFDPETENPLPLERVQMVVARMVIRHLRNPSESRQVTESAGPFSHNRTFAGDRPGKMWLSDDERGLLGYLPGAPSQKAFTVPQPVPETSGWLDGAL